MRQKIHQDIYISLFFILFCGLFLILAKDLRSGAEVLPRMVLLLMMILSILIFIKAIIKTKEMRDKSNEHKQMFKLEDVTPALKAYLTVFAYVVLFSLIGYFSATVIFLMYFMNHLGAKSKKAMILTTSIFLLILYFFFAKQLNVPILGFGRLGKLF